MAILEHEVRVTDGVVVNGSRRYSYTRQDYYTMAGLGVFRGKHVELIEGAIIEKPPITPLHAALTSPIAEILDAAYGPGFAVRTQVPIAIGGETSPSEPEPDVVVAAGSWREYLTRHPSQDDIRLIVEISESTLAYDRTAKAALYSLARIPEYWIVNLVDRKVEVHRQPTDAGYASVTFYCNLDFILPLSAPGTSIPIDEILA